MQRKNFDLIVSVCGLMLAVVMATAGGLLAWGHSYIHHEVFTQLSEQNIYFPAADSAGVQGDQFKDVRKYGGQKLVNGKQAQVYADDYINAHLAKIGGGKTYSELSEQSLANPNDAALAGQVQTMFRGETLRGLLLNAYAFGTMGQIAGIAAIVAFIAAGVFLVLSLLGLMHARKVNPAVHL